MKPQRIRLSRRKGFNLQEHSRAVNGLEAVKVDRSSKWGNPFYVGEPDPKRGTYFACVDIQEAVEAFEYSLLNDGVGVGHLLDDIDELRGKNLACYCQLDVSCHADILLELANSIEVR